MFAFTRRYGLGVRIREIENVLFCRPAFIRRFDVNVVVQFYPWFKFSFILFLDMAMYNNEFESK